MENWDRRGRKKNPEFSRISDYKRAKRIMDIKVIGVRKRCRVLWEVKPLSHSCSGPILRFWRTGKYGITRETMIAAGLDVNRCGAETRQLTFRRIRK